MLRSDPRHLRILLDTGYTAATLCHFRSEITSRSAYFQHFGRSLLFYPFDNLRVAAIRISSFISVLISVDVVLRHVFKFCLVKSVSQRRLQAVEGVRQSIYIANFIAIIRRDGPFANAESSLVKLNQDVSIEMPLIRVLHERNLFEGGAAIDS